MFNAIFWIVVGLVVAPVLAISTISFGLSF